MLEKLKRALKPTIVVLTLLGVFSGVACWWSLRVAVLLLLAALLGSIVPFVCLLGSAAARRQAALFKSLDAFDDKLASTAYAKIAKQYFGRMKCKRLLTTPGFGLPAGFLSLLAFLFALAAFFGSDFKALLSEPNLFLGGIDPGTNVAAYQGGTLLMVSMAALGAYVMVVTRLTRRVNNYDMDPISFYFLSFQIIQAVVVAAVMRHLATIMIADVSTAVLAVVGFGIGLQPDLFLTFIAGWVREKFGVASSPRQEEPTNDARPTNLSLSMLEGMTKEKRARLAELNIDNCQMLAEYNPYTVWARTAFQLQQIVDWIAQAQLYILVKEDGLKKLRPYGIRDIFSFVVAAKGKAKQAVANLLGAPVEVVDAAIENLLLEASFTRLLEVRTVLAGVHAPPKTLATTGSPPATPAPQSAAVGASSAKAA